LVLALRRRQVACAEADNDKVSVHRANAFLVNKIGVAGTPFPFAVRTELTAQEIWTLSLVALDVSEIGAAWVDAALPYTYVWDVGHYIVRPGSNQLLLDAEEIAKARGIEVKGFDVEWARYGRAPARQGTRELIRLRSSDLPGFVADLHTYEFEMIDASHDLSSDELDELVMLAHTRDKYATLLDHIAWASQYVNNHDACYIWQEARSDKLLRAIVQRALASFVSATTQTVTEVAPPTPNVLEHLTEPGSAWTAPQELVRVSDEAATLALAPTYWTLRDELPREASQLLRYKLELGTWEWLDT
jgi:hypothetical protein